MKVPLFAVLIVFLLVVGGFVVYKLAFQQSAPTQEDEKRVLSWVVSGRAFAVTSAGLERVFAVSWDERGYYHLYNIKGVPLGQLTKEGLLQAIEIRANPLVNAIVEMPSIDVPPALPLNV